MAFNLIPFPISILFVVVFGLAWIVVLWKLRERGKVYSILFRASLIIGIFLIVALLYSIMTSMLS
jgi:hypothetical protein